MVEMLFHLRKATKRIISCAVLFIFALLLTTSRAPTTLEEVLNEGELRVVTLKGSTTYFENAKGKDGFDYLLAKAFADNLGVDLKITAMQSLNGVLLSVGGPKGHLVFLTFRSDLLPVSFCLYRYGLKQLKTTHAI